MAARATDAIAYSSRAAGPRSWRDTGSSTAIRATGADSALRNRACCKSASTPQARPSAATTGSKQPKTWRGGGINDAWSGGLVACASNNFSNDPTTARAHCPPVSCALIPVRTSTVSSNIWHGAHEATQHPLAHINKLCCGHQSPFKYNHGGRNTRKREQHSTVGAIMVARPGLHTGCLNFECKNLQQKKIKRCLSPHL